MLLKTRWLLPLLMIMLVMATQRTVAQNIVVNTAMLEGLDITPDNMWGFQIQSMAAQDMRCEVQGSITFRNSNHSIKYKFPYTVKPGLNLFDPAKISPTWSYSSSALKELFMQHKMLPQGTYQYCVALIPVAITSEYTGEKMDDCIYRQAKDLFSITLLEPENNAKLYEYNPMLTWVATYPFVNELTYRVRVAEIKNGQNNENAIARNNPVYSENNLVPNSVVYPVYAKPLRAWQPYAWTVDAYYKGILLGGAQPWRFMIVEDSTYKSLPHESSYIDINIDEGTNRYYAVGDVKIKYAENDFLENELKVRFFRKGVEIRKSEAVWAVKRGVNFNTYDLTDFDLGHNQEFEVVIEFKNVKSEKNKQEIKFKYVNPDFVK